MNVMSYIFIYDQTGFQYTCAYLHDVILYGWIMTNGNTNITGKDELQILQMWLYSINTKIAYYPMFSGPESYLLNQYG